MKAIFTAFPGKGNAKEDGKKVAAGNDKGNGKTTDNKKLGKETPKENTKAQVPLRRPQESSEFQRIFGNKGRTVQNKNAQPQGQTGRTRGRGIPPVVISIGPNGDLILNSNDPATLDRLERIFEQMAPRRKSYKVFYLKNAPASWVSLNIEEFFEDKDAEQDRMARRWGWGWGGGGNNDDKKSRLSKRKKLKFVWDNDTNTILVQNADPDQLKTIQDLIKLYDVPEPKSSQKTRITKLFPIKYSRADLIAATIKDAYRDLLSANDKALQTNNNNSNNKRSSGRSSRTYITNFGGGGAKKDSSSRITYKGKLSIGVNELTNSLVVSVEGENLLKVVGGMIEQLDKAAKTMNSVTVMELGGGVNSQQLHATVAKILGVQGPNINRSSSNRNNNRNRRNNNFNNSNRRSSSNNNSNRRSSSNNNNNRSSSPSRR